MRKLHRGHAIILCVALVLGAVVIRRVHAYQVNRSVVAIFKQAVRAREAGKFDRAIYLLNLYLTKRPADVEARTLAAEIAVDEAFLAQPDGAVRAIRTIENLLILDPDRHDLRLRLVKIHLSAGMLGDAKSNLDIINKASPDNGNVEYYLGTIEERNARFNQAANYYEKAKTHAPDLIEAHVRLARLYRQRMNQAAKGDLLMDLPEPANGLVTRNPKSAEAYLARGVYRRDFKIGSPAADIAKALELAPKDLGVRIAAAREATIESKFDEAVAHIKVAEELFPKKVQVYLAGASIETRARRFDRAIDYLRRGLEQIPDDVEMKWNLADLLVQLGRVDAAETEIKSLKQLGIKRDLTDYLEAVILLTRQKWSEAAPALERTAKAIGSMPEFGGLARRAYLNLGRCYAELGNTDQQLIAYRRALSMNNAAPDDKLTIEARAGVAAALVDMGQIEEAITEYRKSLLLPGATEETKIILARLLIFRNLRMLEAYRQWDEVENLLDTAAAKAPDVTEIAILRAETLAARARIDPARQLLEKARNDHPDRPDLWVALAMLAQRQDQPQEALKILDDAEKKFKELKLPERVEIRIARARIIGLQGGANAAERLGKLGENLAAFPPYKQRDLVATMAEAFVQIGDVKTALELWKKMGLEQPNDLVTRLIQFDMAIQDVNKVEIDRIVGEIRGIEGENGTLWRYAQARLLIEEFKKTKQVSLLIEARNLISRVAQDRPAWSRAPLALGEIDDLRGNPNVAVRGYQRAIQLGDRSSLAVRRAIQILFQQRQFNTADQILRRMQEQVPISGDLQRLAADISLEAQDYARALGFARKSVVSDSADYRDHIWLGNILSLIARRAGSGESARQKEEAKKEFERAIELARDKPDPWVSYIQFLTRENRLAEAEKILAEAEKAIAPNEAPLALGQAGEAMNKLDKVEEYYKKAIELKPDDPIAIQALAGFYMRQDRAADADQFLRKLIDLRGESDDQKNWARRILGLVQARGNFKEAVKALEILGLADEEEEGVSQPIDDLRAKVRILIAQKTLARRNEARRILEDIIRREKPTPDDFFVYAKLFELESNWSKAREHYQNTISNAPQESFYIAEFARALIRHNQHKDAVPWLAKLEALKPGSPESAEIKARILSAEGKKDQAAAILLDYVKDKESRIRITAELLEEMELYDAAEKLYRRLADIQRGDASKSLYLAGFLGRRHRTDEALDICERAWANSKPEDVAEVCVQILYQSDQATSYLNRVADQFERVSKLHPNDVALLFELANIRGLQGQVAEARKIYLDAFQRDPENGAPLNNLAWLLAYQKGSEKEALDYINRAILLHNAVPPLLDTRAVVHMANGTPQPAIKDLEEAIAIDPTPSRQLHLAEAFFMARRRTDAEAALKDAESMGLDVQSLHPFERKSYQALVDQLKKKP